MPLNAAEQDARDLLDTVWWDDVKNDIPIPVDVFRVARKLGLQVFLADMPPDVSGTLSRDDRGNAVIYLNRDDAQTRQRFTCAHEIGHYRSRTKHKRADLNFVDYRSTLAALGTDRDEIWANQFAAGLLMPADKVRELKTLGPDLLATFFGVSKQAMELRFRNLRLS